MSVFRSTSTLVFAELLSRGFSIALSIVVAREIGLFELGILTLALTLIAFATVAGDAGLGISAVRRISAGEDADRVFRQTIILQLLFSIAGVVVVFPLITLQASLSLALAVALVPVVTAIGAPYVLQARLDFFHLSAGRILGNFSVGFSGIFFVLATNSVSLAASSFVIGAAVTAIYYNRASGMRIRGTNPVFQAFSFPTEVVPLVSYILLSHAYSAALLVVCRNFADGVHFIDASVSMRVLLIAAIPAQALSTVLLPVFSRQGGLSARKLGAIVVQSFLLGSVVSIVGVVSSPLVLPLLFGDEATGSLNSVRVALIQSPFAFVGVVLTSALLSRQEYFRLGICYVFAIVALVAWCFGAANAGTPIVIGSLVFAEVVLVIGASVTLAFGMRQDGLRGLRT